MKKIFIAAAFCAAAILQCGCSRSIGRTSSNTATTTAAEIETIAADETTTYDGAELLAAADFGTIVEIMQNVDYKTDFTNVIGKTITFTGKPNAADSSPDAAVFSSRVPRFKIYTDASGWESGEISVSGKIAEISYISINLTDCEILQSAEIVPAETTATTADRTVYVSTTGKYHIHADCSGMTEYTEMALSDAIAAGYENCKRCF